MALVYAVTADLFFAERLERGLQQLGHQALVIDVSAGAAPAEPPAGTALAIVDMEAGTVAFDQIRTARQASIPVLAFGPHVAHDLRQAAREAGAQVVTKSKLTSSFAELVSAALA